MTGYFGIWVWLTVGNAVYARVLTDTPWDHVVSWAIAQGGALLTARLLRSFAP